MNESALRGLVRAILKESIDIQTDDIYVMCALFRRFCSEDDLWAWLNTLDSALNGPSKNQFDPGDHAELNRLHEAMVDVVTSGDLIDPRDSVDIAKAISSAADDKARRVVFGSIMKRATSIIKENDGDLLFSLFGDVEFQMSHIVEGDMTTGRLKRADIVVRKIRAIMKIVADLDPASKLDYADHMRVMARIKGGDLSSVDPEYLEQAAEIILGGEDGVPQALELISMLV